MKIFVYFFVIGKKSFYTIAVFTIGSILANFDLSQCFTDLINSSLIDILSRIYNKTAFFSLVL